MIAVARNKDGLVGFAISGIKNELANLFWLYVNPSQRGARLGESLLQFVCENCKRKGVRKLALSTHDHEQFYARHGFQTVDEQELHGVPMKIMQLELAS